MKTSKIDIKKVVASLHINSHAVLESKQCPALTKAVDSLVLMMFIP